MYEERVVIVSASDQTEAEDKILADFREYGSHEDGWEFLEQYEIPETYDPRSSAVAEVASTTQFTTIEPQEYVDRYWDDPRPASCDEVGWQHVWYNSSDGRSGCYNCRIRQDGELWRNDTSVEQPDAL